MHFKPSRLEARVALDGDQYQDLVARQRGVQTTDDDPFGFFTSLFGGGDDDTTTTTTRRSTTTTRQATTLIPIEPSPIIVTRSTSTSSTPRPTTTSQPTVVASVVTSPPPVYTPSPQQQYTTVTSTSSVDTGNADASQANTNGTSNGGLPSVVIGIIVAASVIFGLIFIALIVRKIFQSRRRNKRNTWATTGVTPFDAPIVQEKALPPPPPTENQAYPSINYPAYPPATVAGITPYNSQPYSPAAASSAGYPAPYPYGTSANAQRPMQQNHNNTTATSFTAADLAGPVVIQHTPPTPIAAVGAVGAVSVVKRTFVPSLPDELPISNGDQVRVLSVYDDGWALCEKVSSGEKGVVPQECLETTNQPSAGASTTGGEESSLNRNSSLRRGPDQTQ